MRQILLHPGFHKTGTSSIQHFLWRNRDALEPYFDLRMFRHMKPVVRLAGHFSRTGDPLDLLDLLPRLENVFTEFPVRSDRDLLISCEGLAGSLPGSRGVKNYAALPVLSSYITGYLADRFPDAQVKVILTTRDGESWLQSVYRHHLRGQRMTMTYDEFATKFQDSANLDAVVNDVAAALAPIEVLFMPLEQALTHPLGPGAAMVDQMNVPDTVRAKLVPVGRGNEGPNDNIASQFFDLNRSDLSDQAVIDAKDALANSISLGGWKMK